MQLTMHDLLRTFALDPTTVRLVRHGNKEIDVLDVFQKDKTRFSEYSAWQKEGKYGDAKYLAIFSPARGTTSLFLGIWSVNGVTKNADLTPEHQEALARNTLPPSWFDTAVYYHLQQTEIMSTLSERLVIEWGKSTLNWVQTQNKTVVQIKPVNSIGDFTSYDRVQLSYEDLRKLIKDTDSNISWVNALSSVNGVYLIKHRLDGRLYVGSAYGKGGILGRWAAYSQSGHAGNKLLKGCDPSNFVFSVLEISPNTMAKDDVIARENRWKECLGSREFGLNEN